MSNILKTEKKIAAVSALCEGSSIRSIERMTGVHRDTIMRLGVRVGLACADLLDRSMRNLSCRNVEIDEVWGFIGKKQANLSEDDGAEFGDVYTFIAIDRDTKIVPAFQIGKRDTTTTFAFIRNLAGRINNRIQLNADAFPQYKFAVMSQFGGQVDFAQIVKTYESTGYEGRYSPGQVVEVTKRTIFGMPDLQTASTSICEKQNHTLRMHVRRLTRLTNAFSKKLENFKAAVALHYGYYNFALRHQTLKTTPAVAAGIIRDQLTVADLVRMSES